MMKEVNYKENTVWSNVLHFMQVLSKISTCSSCSYSATLGQVKSANEPNRQLSYITCPEREHKNLCHGSSRATGSGEVNDVFPEGNRPPLGCHQFCYILCFCGHMGARAGIKWADFTEGPHSRWGVGQPTPLPGVKTISWQRHIWNTKDFINSNMRNKTHTTGTPPQTVLVKERKGEFDQ